MRLAHEANFLEPGFPVGGRAWPALAFCAASSGHFRRHRSLRANRHKLAETPRLCHGCAWRTHSGGHKNAGIRSEEHTSELQSRLHLVCRLLLEKKKTP